MSACLPPARLRDVCEADLAEVHAINEACIPHVNSISLDRFQGFTHEAAYFRIALLDERLAGYLVAFAPGAPYESLNYRWFEQRYSDFIYIDRIAVAASARRRGVAGSLYRDFFHFASTRTGLVTCEVNTRPPNPESMSFHQSFGFRQVGTQETDGGAKTVSLMGVDLKARG
jgi:uncharacterized protein